MVTSFMKREFGKKLIEQFFPTVHLTHVIDTSGLGPSLASHGTSTVILVGRNHIGRPDSSVRVVLGLRGEPSQPADPAQGFVWRAILDQLDRPGSESDWIAVEDARRDRFSHHPWNVSGGGAAEVFAAIDRASCRLGSRLVRIGFYGVIGADDAMVAPRNVFCRAEAESRYQVPLVVGDKVRDWGVRPGEHAFHPYDQGGLLAHLCAMPRHAKRLWPYRTDLGNRATFTKRTYFLDDRPWYEWHQLPQDNNVSTLSITFAEVATHNHFVLGRQGQAYKQTAPVIKLPAEILEDEHVGLLGVLNSSAACFWLKHICFDKGTGGIGGGISDELWEHRFAHNSTKVAQLPLPSVLPLHLGRELHHLAQLLADQEPAAVCARSTPTRAALDAARDERDRLHRQMITLQEELDWTVYRAYGLITEVEAKALVTSDLAEPLALGERAFEIVLARKLAVGEVETAWFSRHRSTPITDLPEHWPPAYREVVEARIAVIENRRDLALIERPECKRRWASEPWERKEAQALRSWLLDRCEEPDLWYAQRDGYRQPRTLSIGRLADQFPPGDDVHAVAGLYAADHLGRRDLPLAQVLELVLDGEHVPYLAALRYQESGLVKRAEWERTWEGQREEDRTGKKMHLDVPPKYKDTDFRQKSYWSHRGKLDVPKERFVSYPGASPDGDPTLLLGWAGWDHKDQAQALVNLVNDRTGQAGWDTDRVLPLLAGLAELMPWLHQWHGAYDPEWDGTPAEEYQAFLDQQRTERQLTEQALRDWRPPAATRGRRRKAST